MGQAKANVAGYMYRYREDIEEVVVSGSNNHEARSIAIVLNGDNSSPSVPTGTGGPQSK